MAISSATFAQSPSQAGCGRLRRTGAGADRRLLLAGVAAGHDAALEAFQQRGRLDHGQLLRRLHGLGAGARHLDGPRRPEARLSLRRGGDRVRASDVCALCRWLLVGTCDAGAYRHGLGRHLHDRPQAPRRSGGREDDVARHSRPCREHWHFGRSVVCHWRPHRRRCRVAGGLLRGRRERRGRLALGGADRSRRKASAPLRPRTDKVSTISGRCSATGRRWPMRLPTAYTRWR